MSSLVDSVANISTPLGIGGLALLVVVVIARRILTPEIIPQLAKAHAFAVVKMLIDRSFVLAVISIVLGFVGYLVATVIAPIVIGSASLSDVLVDMKKERSAVLDFRVVNGTKNDLLITKVRLDPIEGERMCISAPLGYSEVYSFHDIGGLGANDDPEEIPISQVISTGKSDRFGIEVGDTHPGCFDHYWKFKAYLVTSEGILGGQIVEIKLD